MKFFVVSLVCGLQPSTNVTKNSALGVAGVLDPPLELYNVFLKFVYMFKVSKVTGLL